MRPSCLSCNRPLGVCLCAQLPQQPIHTATRVVILQHPHETRQKLATVPIVSRCLSNCDVIVGRRFQLGTSKLLDALAKSAPPSLTSTEGDALVVDDSGWWCRSCGRRKFALLLFPTPSAIELKAWISRLENDEDRQHLQPDCFLEEKVVKNFVGRPDTEEVGVVAGVSPQSGTPEIGLGFAGVCNDGESGHIILLVVDGTWQHAREMVKASMPFLTEFVEQVCLPHDMTREGWGMGDSNSTLKKEPFAGCVSTMEAIARTLGILEPNGVLVEKTMLSVLRQMVFLQGTHFTPMKPRPISAKNVL